MNTKIIKLDINKRLYDKITAKQGDTNSRFLLFNLLDGGIPFNLANRSVRVYAIKPDKKEVFNDLVINDPSKGSCILELTSQILALPGTVKMELMVFETDKKLTSIPFDLEVIAKINSEAAVVSTNEFTALQNALGQVLDINNKFDAVNAQLDDIVKINSKTINNKKCVISFIFDDARQSVYDLGLQLFKNNNITGSIALIVKNLETQSGSVMTPNNIIDMYNNGWSFLCHGYNSTQLTSSVTIDVATRELVYSKGIANKYGIKLDGYVPAYGVIDESFIDIVKKNYKFAFCNYGSGYIDYNKDIYNLNRYSIENKSLATVKAKIAEAKSNNKYLVLYLHDIITDESFANTVANIQEIINYCKSNDIEIMNVAQAMDYYFNIESYNNVVPTFIKQLDMVDQNKALLWSYTSTGGATTKVNYDYIMQPIVKVYWESDSVYGHRYTYWKDLPLQTPTKNLYCSVEIPFVFNGDRMEFDIRIETMNLNVSTSVNSRNYISNGDDKKNNGNVNFVIPSNTVMDNLRIKIIARTTLTGNTSNVVIYTPVLKIYN